MAKKVVLVTGGTGLVGKGIEAYLKGVHRPEETWVYLGSKDGDLTYFTHSHTNCLSHNLLHPSHPPPLPFPLPSLSLIFLKSPPTEAAR